MEKEIFICAVCSGAFQLKGNYNGPKIYCSPKCRNKVKEANRNKKVAEKTAEIQTYFYSLKTHSQRHKYLDHVASLAAQGLLTDTVRKAICNPMAYTKQKRQKTDYDPSREVKSFNDIFWAYCKTHLNKSPMEVFKGCKANRPEGATDIAMPTLPTEKADFLHFEDDCVVFDTDITETPIVEEQREISNAVAVNGNQLTLAEPDEEDDDNVIDFFEAIKDKKTYWS